ncbi:protein of unknown function [Pararobbsia alpina]
MIATLISKLIAEGANVWMATTTRGAYLRSEGRTDRVDRATGCRLPALAARPIFAVSPNVTT